VDQLFQLKNLLIIPNIPGKISFKLHNKFLCFFLQREKPFGLIIVLNSDGNAEGDLFSDDGESIDTIGTKSFYYSTYKWSTSNNRLIINIIENNSPQMSNKILDTLTIYGLDHIPDIININNIQFHPKIRPNTNIVEVNGLGLSMTQSYTLTWTTNGTGTVDPPTEVKYRVDCHPDLGKYTK
jgi:hypothetical protein